MISIFKFQKYVQESLNFIFDYILRIFDGDINQIKLYWFQGCFGKY